VQASAACLAWVLDYADGEWGTQGVSVLDERVRVIESPSSLSAAEDAGTRRPPEHAAATIPRGPGAGARAYDSMCPGNAPPAVCFATGRRPRASRGPCCRARSSALQSIPLGKQREATYTAHVDEETLRSAERAALSTARGAQLRRPRKAGTSIIFIAVRDAERPIGEMDYRSIDLTSRT
jgi:hypothetical protein